MKHEKLANWGRASFASYALILLLANQPARSECLSPSTSAGATATTVYRCPEITPSTAKQPSLVGPEKTTVVERGSSNVPWFEPKPGEAKTEPAKPPKEEVEAVKAPEIKIKTANAPETDEAAQVHKNTATKRKFTSKKRVKKVKLARAKTTKMKTAKVKSAKVKPATEAARIESKPPDEKTIVWTKKDMPIGSRIVNWLGF